MNEPATISPYMANRPIRAAFVHVETASFETLVAAAPPGRVRVEQIVWLPSSDRAALYTRLDALAPDVVILGRDVISYWHEEIASYTESLPVVGWIGAGSLDALPDLAAAGIRDFLFEDSLNPHGLIWTLRSAIERAASTVPSPAAYAFDLDSFARFANVVFDVVDAPVLILASDGTLVRMNRAAEMLFEFSEDELTGELIWDQFFSIEDADRLRRCFASLLDGTSPVSGEIQFRSRHGNAHHILWTGTRYDDPDTGEISVIVTGLDITIRRRAEAALRQNASMFRAIFYDSALGMTIVDAEGRVVESNPSAHLMLGYAPEELQGRSFSIYSHSDDDARDWTLFASLVRGDITHYEVEKRYVRKDGEVRWGRLTVSTVRGEDDDDRFFIRMAEDVTERKLTEQAEAEQRAFIEALQGTSAALTSTLDPDEVLDRLLAEIASVVPYDGATIMLIEDDQARVVRCAGSYLPVEKRGGIIDRELNIAQTWNLRYPLETRAPLIISNVRQDPTWFKLPGMEWVRSHVKAPIRLADRVIGFLSLESATTGFFHEPHASRLQAFADQAAVAIRNAQLFDTVRRYASELEQRVEARTAELANERAQFRAILDAMGEGLVFVEGAQSLRFVNRAFAEISGFSVDEVMRVPDVTLDILTKAISDRDTWVKRVQGTIRAGRTWRGEIVFQRQDGSRFDAGVTVTSVPASDGTMLGQVYLIRDITSQKALQAQKDRFIANASHELRTPLTNIKMRLYLVRKDPIKAPEHLRVMEQVSDRMEELINDLLDVTRFERGMIDLNRTDMILQRLVDHVVMVQRPHGDIKDILLETDYPDEPLHVLADPKRMTQVVTNLLTNAINYTPPQGRIAVRLVREVTDEGEFGVLQVQDNGSGIKPDSLRSIFEPFYRATESEVRGSGLGLTISKEIVERHGGTIWAESKVENGSTFFVRLRLITPP